MADVDSKLISHFLCTHPLDCTKVDIDSYLMKDDLLFYPVKNYKNVIEIHGSDMTRYADRMKILFSRYREKN